MRRYVIDTNLLVSRLLLPDSTVSTAVSRAVRDGALLFSNETISELIQVLSRSKFDSYVGKQERQHFIQLLIKISHKITITQKFEICRDPKDDKFLELAVNGNA